MWRSRRRARDRGLACEEIVELATEYLEGALPSGARAQVEAHLAGRDGYDGCDGCAGYLDQMVRTSALLRAAATPSGGQTLMLSDDVCATLNESFRHWLDPRPDVDGRRDD